MVGQRRLRRRGRWRRRHGTSGGSHGTAPRTLGCRGICSWWSEGPWEWGATRSASRCLRACGRSDLGVDPSMGFGSLHSACTGRPQAGASPGLRWAWAPWLPLWLCFVSWCMRAFLFARMAICGCRPAEDQWGAHVSRSLASRQICLEGWGRASARPEIIRKLPRRFSTPPSLDESAIRRWLYVANSCFKLEKESRKKLGITPKTRGLKPLAGDAPPIFGHCHRSGTESRSVTALRN